MKSIMNIFPIEVDLPISSSLVSGGGSTGYSDNSRTYKQGESEDTEEEDDGEHEEHYGDDEFDDPSKKPPKDAANNLIDISND